jgi:uncharacterized membrane protein
VVAKVRSNNMTETQEEKRRQVAALQNSRGYLLIAVAAGGVLGLYLLGRLSPQVSFSPVGGGWFGEWLVWLLAAALFGLMLLGPAWSRTTPPRRWMLLALRLAVIVLVILMMLRPSLVYWAVSQRSATVIVMIDMSASMKADDGAGQSRFERMKQTLKEAERDLAALAKDLEIRVYGFDSELRELAFSDGRVELAAAPEGEQTAIGWALSEVLKREAVKRIAGVILLSDGAQKALSPRDEDARLVGRRLKGRNQPIFPVVFGPTDSQVQQRDIVLESLQSDGSVHVKNRLLVKGEARAFGYPNLTVPAELLWETAPGQMQVVESKPVRTGASGEATPFDISHAPQTPGLYKVLLRLAKREGELDASNNEQATIVRVTTGGLAVLYLEGGYRLETRNLLRSLGSAANIEVDLLRLDAQKPDQRPPATVQTMAAGLQPGKYDVYVIGDLAAAAFLKGAKDGKGELELLRERVREGAGLIMLGGMFSFGPGDYAGTPLAEVLPVKMSPNDRQDFDAKLRGDQHLTGAVPLRLAPQGKGNFLTLLTVPERNEAAWASLPPLKNGANKLEAREGTTLLQDDKGNPLLIAHNFGQGRVLAFAGDSTWRWAGNPGKTPDGLSFDEVHKRFWRQLILWLAKKDQAEEGRVWVRAKERNVYLGQRIELAAGARTQTGQPLADFDLQAELVRRDETFQIVSREKLAFNRQADQRTLSLKTTQPGDYLLEVRAVENGQLLGAASERFLVREPRQLEMQRPIPDFPAMRELAAFTGGEAVSPREFGRVLDRLKQVPRELEEEVRTVSSLWDPLRAGPLARFGLNVSLAALCGFAVALLLGVEWYLRKKWGLV